MCLTAPCRPDGDSDVVKKLLDPKEVTMKRKGGLATPRQRSRFGVHYDTEAFGQFSETIALTLGTARFLVWQSFIIVVWISFNLLTPRSWQFDSWERGLVLLTLVLSLQASYAAPLILLAQNRQESRARSQSEVARGVAERTQADTDFLAREIASVRVSLTDMVTNEELRDHLDVKALNDSLRQLTAVVEQLSARLDSFDSPISN
jgi:uncharacterized membrane protein